MKSTPAGVHLEEALPGLRVGEAPIGDAHLARDGSAAIQRLGAVAVGDLQMSEAANAQIVDAVDPPIRALAGQFAQAAAIGDAEYPSVPARRGPDLREQPAGHGFEEANRAMQALAKGCIGQRGDTMFARPGGNTSHRIPAAAPGQHQTQQVRPGPHPASAPERPRCRAPEHRGPGQPAAGPETPQNGRSTREMLGASQRGIVLVEPGPALS